MGMKSRRGDGRCASMKEPFRRLDAIEEVALDVKEVDMVGIGSTGKKLA